MELLGILFKKEICSISFLLLTKAINTQWKTDEFDLTLQVFGIA